MAERTSIIRVLDPRTGEVHTTKVISTHPVPPEAEDSVEATRLFYQRMGLELLTISRIEDNEIAIQESSGERHEAGGSTVTRHVLPTRGIKTQSLIVMLAVVMVIFSVGIMVSHHTMANEIKALQDRLNTSDEWTSHEAERAAELAADRATRKIMEKLKFRMSGNP